MHHMRKDKEKKITPPRLSSNREISLRTEKNTSCPEGWRRFGCSCYFKSTENKTWSESRRACQDKGADLVMITSKEEQVGVLRKAVPQFGCNKLKSTMASGVQIRARDSWETLIR
uniref:C-type lectin domain-containing protein n=1 Tax=Maylandia zebra TaxID=106582 RepID=A0A3P9C2N3_9CICH